MERGGVLAAVLTACVSFAGAVVVDVGATLKAKGAHNHAGDRRIVPGLDPTSHKHFFNSDYPEDLTPELHDDFDHPFPVVQDSEEYDKDFVKDENSDNGEWKVQMEYDRLRGKLAQAKADAEKALKLEHKKEKELSDAKRKEAEAKKRAKEAYEKKIAAEKKAAGKLKDAEDKLDGVGSAGGGSDVEKATAEVEGEVSDLENCQKELEEARAKLKKLQEERKKAEALEADRRAKADAAEEAQVKRMKAEEELEGKVAKEAEDYRKAHSEYEKENKSLKEMEEDFKKAEERLRKFRRQAVDSDGGVTRTDDEPVIKSAAPRTPFVAALVSAFAALVASHALA